MGVHLFSSFVKPSVQVPIEVLVNACMISIHLSISRYEKTQNRLGFQNRSRLMIRLPLSVVHSKSCIYFSANISNNSYTHRTRKHHFWSCSTSIISQVFHYLTRGPYSRILFLTGAMALNCLCLLLWRQLGTLLLPRYTCHHQKIHTCRFTHYYPLLQTGHYKKILCLSGCKIDCLKLTSNLNKGSRDSGHRHLRFYHDLNKILPER